MYSCGKLQAPQVPTHQSLDPRQLCEWINNCLTNTCQL